MADKWSDEAGEVRVLGHREKPPASSLVTAFQQQPGVAADALVLRGYLGRSDFFTRTRDYLKRAKRAEAVRALGAALKDEVARGGADAVISSLATVVDAAETDAAPAPKQTGWEVLDKWIAAAPAAAGPAAAAPKQPSVDEIDQLMKALGDLEGSAEPHVPLRLYLTPSLDRYVDFHRSSLLAYRREPQRERWDTFTVWLRIFEEGSQVPVPYRVVQETIIGPSFAAYLGGDLIDDYLGGSGFESSAWGDQSSAFGGGRPGTGPTCGVFGGGRPGTGRFCAG